ncbi:hypothetical protein [Nostoc sp.]|uniref:hypothetical protein n=1 Tax=Nostoc sp. TaxID=1180 RepID=UPI002FF6C652
MSTTAYDALLPDALASLLPRRGTKTRYRRRTHTTSTVGINWRSRKFFGQLEQSTWRLG